jgi:hypothetical protein
MYILKKQRPKRSVIPRASRVLTVSDARKLLCPLLQEIDNLPEEKVAVTVNEEVAAYLVSAKRLEELEAAERDGRRPNKGRLASLIGTAEFVGDINKMDEIIRQVNADAEREWLENWDRQMRELDDDSG